MIKIISAAITLIVLAGCGLNNTTDDIAQDNQIDTPIVKQINIYKLIDSVQSFDTITNKYADSFLNIEIIYFDSSGGIVNHVAIGNGFPLFHISIATSDSIYDSLNDSFYSRGCYGPAIPEYSDTGFRVDKYAIGGDTIYSRMYDSVFYLGDTIASTYNYIIDSFSVSAMNTFSWRTINNINSSNIDELIGRSFVYYQSIDYRDNKEIYSSEFQIIYDAQNPGITTRTERGSTKINFDSLGHMSGYKRFFKTWSAGALQNDSAIYNLKYLYW